MRNKSVATIDAPEFINLQADAINPGISKVDVKVFYLGQNRNGSSIDKDTAINLANTLPGTPIVGVFKEEDDDFGDHGEVIHIENGKIQMSCSTIPYGFVAPDAHCWFQKFIDSKPDGEEIEHEYLMTTAYLWTGQYPELEKVISSPKGQSMELNPDNIQGYWTKENNKEIEFFIITDAEFSKLCILGDDVEPCFEGAAIGKSLYTMMTELTFALKGGLCMDEEVIQEQEEMIPEDEFACGDKKRKYEDEENEEDKEEEEEKEDEEEEPKKSDDAKGKKKTYSIEEYSALIDKCVELESTINSLNEELTSLREFKLAKENEEKEAVFNKYFMLSEEDKADLYSAKDSYTTEQLEEKLALLYVKNNVNFDTIDGEDEEEEELTTTFSLDTETEYIPPIVEALRRIKK